MYSVVLMAALTAGGQAPDCHHNGAARFSGCQGGWGHGHGCLRHAVTAAATAITASTRAMRLALRQLHRQLLRHSRGLGRRLLRRLLWQLRLSPITAVPVATAALALTAPASPYFVDAAGRRSFRPAPAMTSGRQGEPLPSPTKKPGTESLAPSKAKLIVEVPAGAKLYIDDRVDGRRSRSTTSIRRRRWSRGKRTTMKCAWK